MLWFTGLFLLVALGMGIHVAATLGLLAYALAELYSVFPLIHSVGQIAWSANADFILVAVPIFILMGEVLLHSGISRDMYRAMGKWLSWLPGGLMHSNIGSCALFAASSGSSVATAATIGTMALPNIERDGYNPRLFLGTLAAGGTLGILIPPSIPLIVFAVLSETSIILLYLAALIPGLLLGAMFSVSIVALCVLRPDWGGRRYAAEWGDRFRELVHLLPPLGLFLVVVGSIYAGFATPTEAAALGLFAALGLGLVRGGLTREVLATACARTMATTAMILLIVTAAFLLNFVMVSIGFTSMLVRTVTELDLSPQVMMLCIIVFYLLLGCFMETLAMLVATTTIIVPIVHSLGYDPLWFGVVFMILLEAAMITPPIGVNLYVIQSVRGGGPFKDVVIGSMPLLLMMIACIGLLMAFPKLALFLPELYRAMRSG